MLEKTHQQSLVDRGSHSVDAQPAWSPRAPAQTGFTLFGNTREVDEVSPEMFEGGLTEPSFRKIEDDYGHAQA